MSGSKDKSSYSIENPTQSIEMFKLVVLLALTSYGVIAAPEPEAKAEAKPGVVAAAPLVAAAPAVAPAVVTATSSQAFIRNYNTLAAPLVATAPYVAAPASPFLVSPYVSAYSAPYFAAPYIV